MDGCICTSIGASEIIILGKACSKCNIFHLSSTFHRLWGPGVTVSTNDNGDIETGCQFVFNSIENGCVQHSKHQQKRHRHVFQVGQTPLMNLKRNMSPQQTTPTSLVAQLASASDC